MNLDAELKRYYDVSAQAPAFTKLESCRTTR
jgi:hypothetical protein